MKIIWRQLVVDKIKLVSGIRSALQIPVKASCITCSICAVTSEKAVKSCVRRILSSLRIQYLLSRKLCGVMSIECGGFPVKRHQCRCQSSVRRTWSAEPVCVSIAAASEASVYKPDKELIGECLIRVVGTIVARVEPVWLVRCETEEVLRFVTLTPLQKIVCAEICLSVEMCTCLLIFCYRLH